MQHFICRPLPILSSGNGVLPTRTALPGVQRLLDGAKSVSTAEKDSSKLVVALPVTPLADRLSRSRNGFVKVHVPSFTDAEVDTLLSFYRHTGWISKGVWPHFQFGFLLKPASQDSTASSKWA